MINRENYKIVLAYLDYSKSIRQSSDLTISNKWGHLKHVLKWLDDKPLNQAGKVSPFFPEYLLTVKATGKDSFLSPVTMGNILKESKTFFRWCIEHQNMKSISLAWLDSLRIKRAIGAQSRLKIHEYWSLQEVIKLAKYPIENENLLQFRDKAATAFLFLSGMRIGAFVTLPIDCIDLEALKVYQLPERGVKTKFSKAAITGLYNIPELLEVVKKWDDYVKSKIPASWAWYAKFKQAHYEIDTDNQGGGLESRSENYYDGLKKLCTLAGMKFKSPHKLRHGHAVHGLKRSQNMAQYQAVSRNLMHSNIGITDGIYSGLQEDDLFNQLTSV